MDFRKSIPKIGFAITLLGLSFSLEDYHRLLNYSLVGIIALAGIILLFSRISSGKTWCSIVKLAESLDVTYIAFGLGLILASSRFSDNVWATILLLLAGGLFAGAGIGKLIGTGIVDIIETNARVGIVSGFIYLAIGAAVYFLSLDSIIVNPSRNLPAPVMITSMGVILIFLGLEKLYPAKDSRAK